MLSHEQIGYILQIKAARPPLAESTVRTMLGAIRWSPEEIEHAITFLKLGPAPEPPPTPANAESSVNSQEFQMPGSPVGVGAPPPPPEDFKPPESISIKQVPFAPTAPVVVAAVGRSHARLFLILVIIFGLLFAGSVFAYLFIAGAGPFAKAPYTQSNLLSGIFESFGRIESLSYQVGFNMAVLPRDKDAMPFKLDSPPGGEDRVPLYQRDQDRFRDIGKIDVGLRAYFNNAREYPASLATLSFKSADPSGSLYGYQSVSGGADFKLTVTFETPEAIETVRGSLPNALISDKTATFSSKNISSYFSFSGKPKQPILIGFFSDADTYTNYMPSNFKGAFSFAGTGERSSQVADSRFRLTGEAVFGDSTFALDAEIMKKSSDLFARLNKVPSILSSFVDFSKVLGQWVKITPQDIASWGYDSHFGMPLSRSQDDLAKTRARFAEQTKLFVKIASEENALVIKGDPVKEKVGNETAFRYDLTLDRAHVVSFYKRLVSEFEINYATDSPMKADRETLDYLDSPAFGQVFEYLNRNHTLTLWVDGDGFPVKFVYAIRLVPGESATRMKDNQINLSASFSLTDINKPVSIDPPATSLPYEEAVLSVSGFTREEYTVQKQTAAVRSVREALDVYKTLYGTYPDALSDLTTITVPSSVPVKTAAGQTAPVSGSDMKSYYEARYLGKPILKTLPVNAFTEAPFKYDKEGDNYHLSYTMTLSPYKPGAGISGLYDVDYSSGNGTQGKLMVRYANGINTADKKSASLEAAAQSKIDTDGDRVPDSLEDYIGTDKRKKDSDGDGYSDSEEILSDSNPSGPGRLETKRYGS